MKNKIKNKDVRKINNSRDVGQIDTKLKFKYEDIRQEKIKTLLTSYSIKKDSSQ